MFRYVVRAVHDSESSRKLGTYRTPEEAAEAVDEVIDNEEYHNCEFELTDRETNQEWMYTSDGWREVF